MRLKTWSSNCKAWMLGTLSFDVLVYLCPVASWHTRHCMPYISPWFRTWWYIIKSPDVIMLGLQYCGKSLRLLCPNILWFHWIWAWCHLWRLPHSYNTSPWSSLIRSSVTSSHHPGCKERFQRWDWIFILKHIWIKWSYVMHSACYLVQVSLWRACLESG